jgi:hypothetical protein
MSSLDTIDSSLTTRKSTRWHNFSLDENQDDHNLPSTTKSSKQTMAFITDQTVLKSRRGAPIRFTPGTYGGNKGKGKKKGSGYGYIDNQPPSNLDIKRYVIVDMIGVGKVLHHAMVSRTSYRRCGWVNKQAPGASFEERLMKQHPQIEDAIEELCRTLARVHELENHMKNSDDSMMLFIWAKYYEAAVRQSKRIEPNDWAGLL